MYQIANIKSLEVIVNYKCHVSDICGDSETCGYHLGKNAKMHKVPLRSWTPIYHSGPIGPMCGNKTQNKKINSNVRKMWLFLKLFKMLEY